MAGSSWGRVAAATGVMMVVAWYAAWPGAHAAAAVPVAGSVAITSAVLAPRAPVAPVDATADAADRDAACGDVHESAAEVGGVSAAEADARIRLLGGLRGGDAYERSVAAWLDVDAPDHERRLVQEAAASSDARVYGLAFRACHGAADLGDACTQLSARRWLELDPGNGVPWLYLLDEASREHDGSALDEALFQLSRATRFDTFASAPARAIARRVGDDDRAVAPALALAFGANALIAAQDEPLVALARTCHAGPGVDPNVRQLCVATVRNMAERSDNASTLLVGASLASRLTGDPAWTERAQAEAERLGGPGEWMAAAASAGGRLVHGCRAMRRELASISR